MTDWGGFTDDELAAGFTDDELAADVMLSLSEDLEWLADHFPLMRAQALAMRAQIRRELHKDDPQEEGSEE